MKLHSSPPSVTRGLLVEGSITVFSTVLPHLAQKPWTLKEHTVDNVILKHLPQVMKIFVQKDLSSELKIKLKIDVTMLLHL